MAQRNSLGTTLHVCNWAVQASEAKELCLAVTRPGAEHWKLHSCLLGPQSYSEVYQTLGHSDCCGHWATCKKRWFLLFHYIRLKSSRLAWEDPVNTSSLFAFVP